ncbi:hypoxia induced protein conserved region-domain-containing protein [Triangularia verruculosa]|uniref:Hypoxia induced protein conserved region-domain-containing protein n=1 Tax=Triangularia verruculosa TaxID=2587418 RepID=A0AAN7AQ56_9PEZI|nr:hypoxia induced protein conserved region-domain-containing protein [Triangularia verruculosa]
MPDGPLSGRPLPSSFDSNDDFYNENGFRKVLRRLKEEPLVPIGCLLTVAAFTNAYRAMRRGDHAKVQKMFRARVAAQGFTVLAMVAGGIYYQADRHKQRELWKLQQQKDAEEKHQKWIRELEARDEEEKALQERLDKRRKRAAERAGGTGTESVAAQARAALRESKAGVTDSEKTETGQFSSAEAAKSSSGVLGSVGGWFGGSKKAPEDTTSSSESNPENSK